MYELNIVNVTVLDNEGSTVDESVDANVGNIVSLTKGEPEGVLYKFVGLASEDSIDDDDTLEDDDVEGDSDNVAIVVEVIDMSGDAEVEEETEAFHDVIVSLLLEGIDMDETLEEDDIEGELDNDISDVIDAEDEMLEVNNGLFEKVLEEAGEKLSDTKAVALLDGGFVDSPVGISLLDDSIVGELKRVEEPKLDNGDLVTTPVSDVVSVKKSVCVDDGKIVAELRRDLEDVDNGLVVTSGTFETVLKFGESEIFAI